MTGKYKKRRRSLKRHDKGLDTKTRERVKKTDRARVSTYSFEALNIGKGNRLRVGKEVYAKLFFCIPFGLEDVEVKRNKFGKVIRVW